MKKTKQTFGLYFGGNAKSNYGQAYLTGSAKDMEEAQKIHGGEVQPLKKTGMSGSPLPEDMMYEEDDRGYQTGNIMPLSINNND